MQSIPWKDIEREWLTFAGEVRRLYRRNRRNPLPLLLVAALTTAAGVYFGYRWRPAYEARIALRITEHDVGVSMGPRPIAALRAYVTDVALTDRVLERILDRFQLYMDHRSRGLDQALAALREDIGVEVWRNEFLVEAADEVGRSARIALSYQHHEPEVAWGVVEALADAAIAEQRRGRRAQAEHLAMGLEPAIESLELRLMQARRQLTAPPAPGVPAALDVQRRIQLYHDLEEMEAQWRDLTDRLGEARLRLRAESLNLGLRTEVIDTLRPQVRPYHQVAIALGAVLGLLAGLLLGGVTIVAFDRRIYDEEDLGRLGLSLCGGLPAYPGDDVGSMKSRVRMTDR